MRLTFRADRRLCPWFAETKANIFFAFVALFSFLSCFAFLARAAIALLAATKACLFFGLFAFLACAINMLELGGMVATRWGYARTKPVAKFDSVREVEVLKVV